MSLKYFDELVDFSDFQALRLLFIHKLKIEVYGQPMTKKGESTKVSLDIYDLKGNFLKSFIIPDNPTTEAMRSLVEQLNRLATNQL
jgi:hypothetical protein